MIPSAGMVERPRCSTLADVIDTILDKGLVIDAFVRVSLVGIELLTIDARIVVASVDTYLRFAEAVGRLDLHENRPKDLPGLVEGLTHGGAKGKTTGVLESAGEKVRDFFDDEDDDRQPARRRRARPRPPRSRRPAEPGHADPARGGRGAGQRAAPGRPTARRTGGPHHTRACPRSVAGAMPVLPLRFGVVVDSDEDVLEEWLTTHHDEFADALRELRGRAEYQLRGRYDERAILTEVLSENRDAARLREAIRDKPEDASWPERMALGELVAHAITAKRDADTRHVVEALGRLDATLSVSAPTHERDAVHVAILLDVTRERELERLTDELARAWSGRVTLRLLGPVAPYDFVAMEG